MKGYLRKAKLHHVCRECSNRLKKLLARNFEDGKITKEKQKQKQFVKNPFLYEAYLGIFRHILAYLRLLHLISIFTSTMEHRTWISLSTIECFILIHTDSVLHGLMHSWLTQCISCKCINSGSHFWQSHEFIITIFNNNYLVLFKIQTEPFCSFKSYTIFCAFSDSASSSDSVHKFTLKCTVPQEPSPNCS